MDEGYRDIPTVGPLFLADAIVGFVLAVVLLVWPRPSAGLLGAGFMISTLGGLIVSLNFGLLGYRESSGASFVTETIILEAINAVPIAEAKGSAHHGLRHERCPGRQGVLVGSSLRSPAFTSIHNP